MRGYISSLFPPHVDLVATDQQILGGVSDSAAFNGMLLKTHKLLPLSTFGIRQGPDGRDYYEMFGSLSAGSDLEAIVFEIETLADNAMQVAADYQSDLRDVA